MALPKKKKDLTSLLDLLFYYIHIISGFDYLNQAIKLFKYILNNTTKVPN